mmetsp:Transcript_30172/g.76313  ORF Transcript_30172/g.76313 Transcript_30172/m.76313 type:complete len:82 (-) Transcript_30172:33-278(-)
MPMARAKKISLAQTKNSKKKLPTRQATLMPCFVKVCWSATSSSERLLWGAGQPSQRLISFSLVPGARDTATVRLGVEARPL